MLTVPKDFRAEFSRSTRNWLVATTFATLFLAAVIPAVIYAAILAFALPELGPLGISWTTWAFLILLSAAIAQAFFATRNRAWNPLLNWFLGIWLAYWVWGLFINSFGYDRSSVVVLLRDNTHPAMWTFPLVIMLIWWLKPSGVAICRGLDIAILTIFAIIGVRILAEPLLPTSLDPFRWTTGLGWFELPFSTTSTYYLEPSEHSADWWKWYQYRNYGVEIRPSLIFQHANTLGFLTAFVLVYGLASGKKWGFSIALGGLLILLVSTSRTALVSATVGALVFVYCFWSRRSLGIRKLLFVAFALAFTTIALAVYLRNPTLTGRIDQWKVAWNELNLRVLTGVDGDNWIDNVALGAPVVGGQLHNSFLSALAWGSLVGLILLIALWVAGALLAFQAAKAGNLASLALLTTCLVLSMTEATFAYRYWSMGNALLLAAVILSQWRPSETKALPTELDAQTAALPSEPLQTPPPK